MSRKELDNARSGQDFLRIAEHAAGEGRCTIRNGHGSHAVIRTPAGTSIPVPVHGNKQLGPGLRSKLIKWFLAAGLGLLLLALRTSPTIARAVEALSNPR